MSSDKTPRRQKVEFLLRELQFEIQKGLIADDLGEQYLFDFNWMSPDPKGAGFILSRFQMRPREYLYSSQLDETIKSHKPKE